jgi:hypothetical protein
MRNIISLAALLLTFVGDFVYGVHQAGTCLDDAYHGGTSDHLYLDPGTSPRCTASNFKFDRVTGATVDKTFDKVAQDPCNCDCAAYANPTASSPDYAGCSTCTGAPGDISCEFEGKYYEAGTVFGACLGDDDYISIKLKVKFTVGFNSGEDFGIYIATDGGENKERGEMKIMIRLMHVFYANTTTHCLHIWGR